jgi:hypothetical protein
MHLIQLSGPAGRRIGQVSDTAISLIRTHTSIWSLAQAAIAANIPLGQAAEPSGETLPYDAVYSGTSEWRILPAIDHPEEPARCLVSGTGLSHIRSAANRQAMHSSGTDDRLSPSVNSAPEPLTDSMRMYQWGVEGGRPAPGAVGVAPEWFYKGTGSILRAHGEPLDVPSHADDGGEEPEIAGIYIVDSHGHPRRIGFAAGNEFSDHVFEKKNYLYLAGSKLRTCAIGPELVITTDFHLVNGEVTIERRGAPLWTKPIHTGESVMCHSLANLEHHHFKYDAHRRPGDVHVHFFGADAFSFGEGIRLLSGDIMQVRFDGFGRPLRNPVRIHFREPELVTVQPL